MTTLEKNECEECNEGCTYSLNHTCICPCHSLNTKTGDWEHDLHRLLDAMDMLYATKKTIPRVPLFSFIRETHTQLLNELIAEVEGMKEKKGWMPLGFSDDIYNKTVDRIKSLLENKRDSI